jgi:hypothetical protein
MSTHEVPGVGADKLYEQLSANIRATDDISFKLLGLVPLVSGAALGALLFKDAQPMGERLSPSLITLLALFAAAVTLGLFRWELRNVQECSHLIGIAGALARKQLVGVGVPLARQARPPRPQGIGKTEAEKIIYGATILAWLALPPAVGAVSIAPLEASARTIAYLVIAAAILLGVLASLVARTRPPALERASDGETSQRAPAVEVR